MSAHTITGTDATFTEIITQAGDKAVVVDFWAPWCGPCKMIAPHLDTLAEGASVKVVKINIDDNPNVASKLGIRSIPTLVLFKNGERVDTKVGAMSKAGLDQWLKDKV